MSINNTRSDFTIATLNLWRFYEWEKRYPAIIELLQDLQPDIIFTQETQRNIAIDSRDQADIIRADMDYPYHIFASADIKHKQKGRLLTFPVEHGLGVISKWPISAQTVDLTQAQDDKERRIVLFCSAQINGTRYSLANLHFSNSDKWAEDHFKETLRMVFQKDTLPILAGDFNIYNLSTSYHALYNEHYTASSDHCDYISYPADNSSLDYILLPKGYVFNDVQCRPEYISDHRLLIAHISADVDHI